MTIDEVVQFVQDNAQAIMIFATPKFADVYLEQMRLVPLYKDKLRTFINGLFKTIDTATTQSISTILGKTDKSLSSRETLLSLLAYLLTDENGDHAKERIEKEEALKNFIKENEPVNVYLQNNIIPIRETFIVFYVVIKEDTRRLIPWLSDNADFLAASIKPEFSKFVGGLLQKQRDDVTNYSDSMKQFFTRPCLRDPNLMLTDIVNFAIFDPLAYYLTRIMLLSDVDSRMFAENDLIKFFSVNPTLLCFMAFETETLDPIVRLWRATQLSNSMSRVTYALTSNRPSISSSTQSTSRLAASDEEADDFREYLSADKKRNDSRPAVNDDDGEEHISTSAFDGPLVKREKKESSDSESAVISLVRAIPAIN